MIMSADRAYRSEDCPQGIRNESRIVSLEKQLSSLTETVGKLTDAVNNLRMRQAWQAGVFAAVGALAGGWMSNILPLLGGGK